MRKIHAALITVTAALTIAGCANLKAGQEVQAGRNALQTGHPEIAVGYLVDAAATDPSYRIPFRFPESVMTYLGRAYYETGKYAEARNALEKALAINSDDHLARVYLGLVLMREREQQRGRKEITAGLKGIHDDLEFIAADNVHGIFWDPARSIRSAIESALAPGIDDSVLVASAEQIGRKFDEEIDKARRDEGRFRAGRGDSSGD
jgi:tetratricopeptide (TPR) repeat protein